MSSKFVEKVVGFLCMGIILISEIDSINARRLPRSARIDQSWIRNEGHGVVFVYDGSFGPAEASNVILAAKEIRYYSCINIKVLSHNEFLNKGGYRNRALQNFVYITKNAWRGCFSDIGMVKGMQRMNLDPIEGCTLKRGTIMHEMMHSLGYDHEQNRPDRNQFVSINFGNVLPGREHNFKIKPYAQAVGPYDYNSIMQYGAYAFSRGYGYPTILSRRGFSVPSNAPTTLSLVDKQKIRYITGCKNSF